LTTDDRATSGPIHTLWKTSNGHNSATRHPIPFMFSSRVRFTETADQTIKAKMAAGGHFEKKFKWPYLYNTLPDSL